MGHKYTEDRMVADIIAGKYDKSKFVTVTDYWAGNYDGDKILVRLCVSPYYKGLYRVSFIASGNDDTDVKMYQNEWPAIDAISLFKLWDKYIYERIPEGCNMEWFFERGFFYD